MLRSAQHERAGSDAQITLLNCFMRLIVAILLFSKDIYHLTHSNACSLTRTPQVLLSFSLTSLNPHFSYK